MKKWLLAAGLGLALATSAQAADKLQSSTWAACSSRCAETGVSNTLEMSSRPCQRTARMETDLQAKMKKLQSMKAGSDRTKLEKT